MYRIEKDSMGEVKVPENAKFGAQTQRAHYNFPISGIRFTRAFIKALGIIKKNAAQANFELGLLDQEIYKAIQGAAQEIIDGNHDKEFVVDIFQTGSGTSSNMNANEVVARLANESFPNLKTPVHPNDHVNFGQSSNDVIPTAIRISAVIELKEKFIPALKHLAFTFDQKGSEYKHVVKTGRTHLMDAMPITIAQQFGGYARQLRLGVDRIQDAMVRLSELPQGGTAVGTGINTHPDFASEFAKNVSKQTGVSFIEAENHFEAQATVDAPVEMSAQIKTVAVGMMKIANDLRWMNSGPNSGLGEIRLATLQPGSSIMPGKVNPVIEESVSMVCAQVIGNDLTVSLAGQSGNFELNVMLPVVAHNLLESIELLANAANNLADRSVSKLTIREDIISEKLGKNPVLITALNPIIGYDLAAKIAKKAYEEGRALRDVAKEMTNLSDKDLNTALNPMKMTQGGFTE
ncbi:MAG: aspartate ammonia-lyase [Balneola sp.]|nr:aspartate ammonia-lyase [Balneola sp.]|tara:strand:+ start:2372 stop:3757 length:1386 start_codon:yes stop_codon:yes gene_type:complete